MDLTTMRTRVLTDILNDPNAGTWSNAEIDSWVNFAYLSDLVPVIENIREGYFETTDTINFTANTQEYSLDALSPALKRVIRVETKYKDDDEYQFALPMDKEEIRTRLANDAVGLSIVRNPGYYLVGGLSSTQEMGFVPIPDEDVTDGATVWYIPNLDELTASDEPSLPVGWHRMLVIYAGAKCLQKGDPKNARASELLQEYELKKNQMIQGIRPRIQSDSKRVVEVDLDYEGDLI